MLKSFRFLALGVLLLPSLALAAQQQGNPKMTNQHLRGRYSFRLTPATSFAPWYDGTNGKDSGVVLAPRQDVLRVGTFVADGKGAMTGHTIATTDDGLTTVVIDFNWTGAYAVNEDGTGTLTLTPVDVTDASCVPAQIAGDCATFEGVETFAFVINSHGEDKTVDLIQTDNEGGGAKIFLTGQAKRR